MEKAHIKARGINISFTFGFFAVWAAILIWCPEPRAAMLAASACAMHEAGHIIAMRIAGIRVRSMKFYSGGIALKTDKPCECAGLAYEMLIILAGCAVNLILFLLSYAAGAELFGLINLALMLFNLLPVSGLDGGRAVRAAVSGLCPMRDIDGALRICSLAAGAGAAVLYIVKGDVSFTLPLALAVIAAEVFLEE